MESPAASLLIRVVGGRERRPAQKLYDDKCGFQIEQPIDTRQKPNEEA